MFCAKRKEYLYETLEHQKPLRNVSEWLILLQIDQQAQSLTNIEQSVQP